jgi:DNA-binding NarL/FixJ family response regulator
MVPADGRVWRVLLADDEADLRRLMTMALEFDDRLEVVAQASNGAQAIELAQEVRPDLAILDQMLGGAVTGLDVAGHLRATQPDVKLILFSAASHEEDLLAGRVDELVTKSDIADLGDIAVRVLSQPGRDGAPTPAE